MRTAVAVYEIAIVTFIGDDSAIAAEINTCVILKSVALLALTFFGGVVVVELSGDVAGDALK